ncbi:MAG: tryptophan synthase subunit alpha [Bacilli bacterium]|nr:tryptophan synthase subunit alpha [Bacilli bacterium]
MSTNVSRIAAKFAELGARKETAFIPFITAGDPTLAHTRELLFRLQDAGADIVELGIPYSDPLADGPVIQAAALRSLAGGTTIDRVFDFVRQLRADGFHLPLIFFTYINPVLQRGIDSFFSEAADSGADGVIIPDLPVEEADEAQQAARAAGMDLIPLVAPTSQNRIQRICSQASGFIYCVATLGVTGARETVSTFLPAFVASVREYANVPVAVGFGVSSGEQAKQIAAYADGIIVGSALVRRVQAVAEAMEALDEQLEQQRLDEFSSFAQSLKAPLRGNL